MTSKKSSFAPIELITSKNVIRREGYYNCTIAEVNEFEQNEEQVLKVEFEVAAGKYRGFRLSTKFFVSFKSRLRLTHLCNAVGIHGSLNSPEELIGRQLKLRVIPKKNTFNGSLFYLITRFHPLDDK